MNFDNKYRKKEDNMKKGFTLIELLAVIIILAVIALIATPIVLNVVDNAKESARKSSVAGYADAVKLARTEAQFNNLPFNDNDLSDLSIETNINNVRCNEVTFDTTMGIILTGCYVDDYTGHAYNYSKGVVTPDVPDTNAPIVTAKNNISDVTDNISSYFNFDNNGTGIITNITCTEGENVVTLVSLLSAGEHNITCTATKANSLSSNATTTIENNYKEIGVNSPDLLDGMIPVKYDIDHWVYADITEKWFEYGNNKKEWANAVILNNGVSKTVGDTITENDISRWYVWIPRYKYTIFNGNNESVDVQLINVTFENGKASTGTVECTDQITAYSNASGTIDTTSISETCRDINQAEYAIENGESTYTHPAFTLNGKELTGIWVGKFEVSSVTNCEPVEASKGIGCDYTTFGISIKPNVDSWRGARVGTYYTAIKALSTANNDSHMIKNMEWGAVAYLKQSQYGLGTTDIGFNNYNSDGVFRTGCGTDAESVESNICNAYDTANGMKASTTGNIYGIYDMSGGAWDYTMGNTAKSTSSPIAGYDAQYNSGFVGKYIDDTDASGANAIYTLDLAYTDLYSYDTSSQTHGRGKLGDATKEVLRSYGNTSGGWTDDYTFIPSSTTIWFGRGGRRDQITNAGVFALVGGFGSASLGFTSRAVLTRKTN